MNTEGSESGGARFFGVALSQKAWACWNLEITEWRYFGEKLCSSAYSLEFCLNGGGGANGSAESALG